MLPIIQCAVPATLLAPARAASLLLEAADLLAPVLRTLWCQLSAAASWLLVQLVGRAVALVRRGVRQGSAAPDSERGSAQRRPAQQQQQQAQQKQQERRPKQRRERSGDRPLLDHGAVDGWAWQM